MSFLAAPIACNFGELLVGALVSGIKTKEETAKLICGEHDLDIPIVVGTENESALDISRLRRDTGLICLDEGYVNTGSTRSAVTFLDGESGVLRYRGYPIEDLASNCDFVEVCYLLIYGELPNGEQLDKFRTSIRNHTMLHEDMRMFYDGFPRDAHRWRRSRVLSVQCRPFIRMHWIPPIRSMWSFAHTACWPSFLRSRLTVIKSRLVNRLFTRTTTFPIAKIICE